MRSKEDSQTVKSSNEQSRVNSESQLKKYTGTEEEKKEESEEDEPEPKKLKADTDCMNSQFERSLKERRHSDTINFM